MNHADLSMLAAVHGDAFYLFDRERFVSNYRNFLGAFRQHYRNTIVAYSYKTNYTPAICREVDALGGYAEVVSEMEYSLARRLDVAPNRIIYNGPCKSPSSLRKALVSGSIVNLDSERDLRLFEEIAAVAPAASMRVAIRCNFPLEGCEDSRFGMDVDGPLFAEAVAAVRRTKNARLAGLHCHFPNRDLGTFAGRIRRMLELATREFSQPPEFLNLGGGFFGEVPASLRSRYGGKIATAADYAGAVAAPMAAAYGNSEGGPVLFVEPGTAVVADTFRFVTRVIDRKTVRSRELAFVAGSIFNISPYARVDSLPVTVVRAHSESGPAATGACDVVGYTCIEGDVLTRNLRSPPAVGDFIVYENVGSYSVVMKPPFILPSVPILMVSGSLTDAQVIKRAETMTYPFENFVL